VTPTSPILRLLIGAAGLLIGLSSAQASAAGLSLTSQNLTPYRTCTVTATPTTTTAVADATVRQGSPNTNYGSLTTITVSTSGSANQRSYVSFSLSGCSPAIPASATVRAATLRLYLSAIPAVCRTLDLFKVLATWSESTITWNLQPFGTTINNPASASRSGAFTVGTPTGCTNRVAGYVTGADVTADVAAFVAGSSSNYGWMIRDDAEGSATAYTATFSSKTLGTIAQAPQLVVTYVTVP
jgi:hypothetical protein